VVVGNKNTRNIGNAEGKTDNSVSLDTLKVKIHTLINSETKLNTLNANFD